MDIGVHSYVYPQFEEVEIIPIADTHIGSPGFVPEKLDSVLKYIESRENAFTVLLGDIMSNTTIDSVGNVYDERMNPQEQLQKAIFYLSRVRGKILGCVSGNHEYRTERKSGIDLSYALAEALQVPLYDRNIAIVDLCIGNRMNSSLRRSNFTIAIYHGTGAGRMVGTKVTAAHRIADMIPNVDIYLSGHGHFLTTVKDKVMLFDKHNKTLQEFERWFVTAPAYVDMEEYALRNLSSLSASGMVRIKLVSARPKQILVESI